MARLETENGFKTFLGINQFIAVKRGFGAGDSVGATVAWRTTGGSILPDGRFSAGAVGR